MSRRDPSRQESPLSWLFNGILWGMGAVLVLAAIMYDPVSVPVVAGGVP